MVLFCWNIVTSSGFYSSFFILHSAILLPIIDFILDLQKPDLILGEAFTHRQVIFYCDKIIGDRSGSFVD